MDNYYWIICKDPKNRTCIIGAFQNKIKPKSIVKQDGFPKLHTITQNNYKDTTNMIEAILTSPLPKYHYIRQRFGIKKLEPKDKRIMKRNG